MTRLLKQLFSDNGSISMMRVMSLLCCSTAISIAIIGLYHPPVDYSGLSLLVGAFLASAFGGKIAQKRIEINGTKTITEDNIK